MDDMKRTLNANGICLPGSVEERVPRALPAPNLRNTTDLPDLTRLGMGDGNNGRSTAERPPSGRGRDANRMFRSSLNAAEVVSPRMETQRLFGGEIAR
jgi:hypothetical protein